MRQEELQNATSQMHQVKSKKTTSKAEKRDK